MNTKLGRIYGWLDVKAEKAQKLIEAEYINSNDYKWNTDGWLPMTNILDGAYSPNSNPSS